ncbi:MAG TPA: cobalamin-dependent protein [Candidatus Baltobacteraceae bacterium]|nr:cobalamin-dependent protein [Candidatus Baltobacteraceae bacterium]
MSKPLEAFAADLLANRPAIAEKLVEREFAARAHLYERFGPAGRVRCLEDAQLHIEYLAEALRAASVAMFCDYVSWADTLLVRRGIPSEHLAAHLRELAHVVREREPHEQARQAAEYVEAGVTRLERPAKALSSFIDDNDPLAPVARNYLALLLGRNERAAADLVVGLAQQGTPVREIYLFVLQVCQYEIGRLWHHNEISVAQEHYFTQATLRIMGRLLPLGTPPESRGLTIVCTSTGGEQHDLGIRMVSDFFAMNGWTSHFLGANTPVRDLTAFVSDTKADALAVSVTLAKHLTPAAQMIAGVKQAGLQKDPLVITGGRAFTSGAALWRAAGADLYAENADSAVIAVNQILAEFRSPG